VMKCRMVWNNYYLNPHANEINTIELHTMLHVNLMRLSCS
jgi:hypothetical protein